MRNNSYAPHYAISRYSIREFKTGSEPFMVAMIIIIIIRYQEDLTKQKFQTNHWRKHLGAAPEWNIILMPFLVYAKQFQRIIKEYNERAM